MGDPRRTSSQRVRPEGWTVGDEREGWTAGDAAEAGSVRERSVWKWPRRYRGEGHLGLLDRTARPRWMPQQLGETWRPRVRALRREHRLSRARDLEPKLPPRRYARSGPGELLHLDVKKLGRIEGVGHRITGVRTHRNRGIGWDHVHVGTDDHSRAA